MNKNILISLRFSALLCALLASPASVSGVISYSGIGIQGNINALKGVESLSSYEEGLYIESLAESVDFGSYAGNQYKIETNYTDVEMDNFTGSGIAVPVLIGANFSSNAAFSFENSSAANLFTDRLTNRNFSTELTNAMLHSPHQVNSLSGYFGLTVEPVAEQTRSINASFGNTLFTDKAYGQFSIDYSLSGIANNVNSVELVNDVLGKSVNDYLTSFENSLFDLNAFEQDFSFTTVELIPNKIAIETNYSQRFWFNDEDSALAALSYFEQDVYNVTENGFKSPLLNGFELKQSSLSFIKNSTEVPEPTSLALLFFAMLGMAFRKQKKATH